MGENIILMVLIKKTKHKLKAWIKHLVFKKYYVFGDSHTEVFDYISKKKLLPYKNFIVTSVGGATAVGMRNPNSKTNSLSIFKEKIIGLPVKSNLIFQLGEVDTGFVIWYRAQKYNETVNKQLHNSIKAYLEFILDIKGKGYNNIAIMSAPLPTILDNQDWGEIANLRKEVRSTLKERTDLTLEYNKLLKDNVNKLGCKFIDTDNYLLNKETHVINDLFRNKDKNNHHLDLNQYSKAIVNAIKNQEV